jgi:predicted anti-sigma-YlaC factor YlaD
VTSVLVEEMLIPVPPTDCMLAREAVSARLDGELAELDALRLEAHLRDCDECSVFAGRAGKLAEMLRNAALEPAPVPFEPRAAHRSRVAGLAVAAAAIAVVAAVAGPSFLLGRLLAPRTPASAGATAVAAVQTVPSLDPALRAMLDSRRAEPGRAIAI